MPYGGGIHQPDAGLGRRPEPDAARLVVDHATGSATKVTYCGARPTGTGGPSSRAREVATVSIRVSVPPKTR